MRALLALAVLSLAAPTVANACGMRIERPQANLADLMDEVDEAEAEKPEAVVEAKPEVAEDDATADADAKPEAQPQAPKS